MAELNPAVKCAALGQGPKVIRYHYRPTPGFSPRISCLVSVTLTVASYTKKCGCDVGLVERDQCPMLSRLPTFPKDAEYCFR
jgi:hypothetical protein